MSRLKITKGKNFAVIPSHLEDPTYTQYNIIVNPVNGWGKWVADAKSASIIDGTLEEAKANGELIADAFNTANETQLLPSELKEQRDDLLGVLKGLVSDVGNLLGEHDFEWQQAGYFNAAKELINEIENNE